MTSEEGLDKSPGVLDRDRVVAELERSPYAVRRLQAVVLIDEAVALVGLDLHVATHLPRHSAGVPRLLSHAYLAPSSAS